MIILTTFTKGLMMYVSIKPMFIINYDQQFFHQQNDGTILLFKDD